MGVVHELARVEADGPRYRIVGTLAVTRRHGDPVWIETHTYTHHRSGNVHEYVSQHHTRADAWMSWGPWIHDLELVRLQNQDITVAANNQLAIIPV